jgi:amino acid transporter
VFGAPAAHWFAVLTLFSAGGYLVADTLSSPRVGFALARAGQMPSWVGYVHPQRRTPVAAIILYAVLVVIVTASGTFRQIAVLATAGTLLLYLIACLSVLRLRTKGVAGNGTPFVAPGGAVVPLAASAIIVWLLSTLARNELVATLVFVAVAAVVYAIVHRPARTRDVVA